MGALSGLSTSVLAAFREANMTRVSYNPLSRVIEQWPEPLYMSPCGRPDSPPVMSVDELRGRDGDQELGAKDPGSLAARVKIRTEESVSSWWY